MNIMLAEIDKANWIMAVCTIGLFIIAIIQSARKTDIKVTPQPLSVQGMPPGNAEIQLTLKQLNARVKSIEDWRQQLVNKLQSDKEEVLSAGELRATKIHDHIDRNRIELDQKIDDMPERILGILKTTGKI